MIAGAYLVWATLATALQGSLIYPFGPHPFERAGYNLTVVDDAHLYHRAAGGDGPVVLFFMGNGGALAYFEPVFAVHEAAGRSVVALQYPGGGGVAGRPNEALLKAQALTAYDWLAEQTEAGIVVHGYSMGTSLAQYVASERTVDGIILDAPFVRMCEVMTRNALLPACYMPLVQRWDSAAFAEKISAPVLIQHGLEDTLIPSSDGQRLAALLETQGVDVTLTLQPGVGHNDLTGAQTYRETIDLFWRDLFAR